MGEPSEDLQETTFSNSQRREPVNGSGDSRAKATLRVRHDATSAMVDKRAMNGGAPIGTLPGIKTIPIGSMSSSRFPVNIRGRVLIRHRYPRVFKFGNFDQLSEIFVHLPAPVASPRPPSCTPVPPAERRHLPAAPPFWSVGDTVVDTLAPSSVHRCPSG